jgi:hypothetical protein
MYRQEDVLVQPKVTMTEEEFEKRVKDGEKLVILDNLVLDIGGYAYAHPGGAHLINYNTGRDISKFIYGSYALIGNSNNPKAKTDRYTHSNVARKIANKHAIATLRKDAVVWNKGYQKSSSFKIDHQRSNQINNFTYTFCFTTTDGEIRPGIQHYFSKLHQLGMHYHVISIMQNGAPYEHNGAVARRHYTTSNILERN